MTTDSHIIVQDASLRFRSYRNPSPNLKETVVDKLTKKSYASASQEFDALKNINLEIRPGDRLGILGLNGAGKSTLLKMIVGIYPPQQGQVSVRGKITPMIELGTGFDAELSGRENIYLNGTLIGRSYKQMKQLEDQIIEFSELGSQIDMPIKYYSSGMHARLAFSIGAIADPEILIMDEIFAAGDAQFVGKSLNRLHQMFDKAHILILVSHSEKHILNICNRAIVLNKGELVMQGSTADCVDHYMRDIVKDPTWDGAEQWIIDPLSFKDRKIMERLSAAHALEYVKDEEGSADLEDASVTADSVDQDDSEWNEVNQPGLGVERPTRDIFKSDSGISLGDGWHYIEKYDGLTFRWVDNNAEVHLPKWKSNELIHFDIEAQVGGDIGRPRGAVKLLDSDGKIVDEVIVTAYPKMTSFFVPERLGGTTVRFCIDADNDYVGDKDRVLNFRVFKIALRYPEPVVAELSAIESEIADKAVSEQRDFAPPTPEPASVR